MSKEKLWHTEIRHAGYCYPDCGCPESEAFDWHDFANAINSDATE